MKTTCRLTDDARRRRSGRCGRFANTAELAAASASTRPLTGHAGCTADARDPVSRGRITTLLAAVTILGAVWAAPVRADRLRAQDHPPERDAAPQPERDAPGPGERDAVPPGRHADSAPVLPPGAIGPRRDDRRPRPPAALWARMSEEERADLLAFLADRFPDMAEDLEVLRNRHPERYDRRMKRIAWDIVRLMDLCAHNPDVGRLAVEERRLDLRARGLARRYRNTDDAALRQRIRNHMRETIAAMFDLRHERRSIEIEQVRQRVHELERRHEEISRHREEMIDHETQERLDPHRPTDRLRDHPRDKPRRRPPHLRRP
ncbi:MAG: hypothetical protein ACE5E6_06265 [Phycisphaerae bacterium]